MRVTFFIFCTLDRSVELETVKFVEMIMAQKTPIIVRKFCELTKEVKINEMNKKVGNPYKSSESENRIAS